MDGKVIIRSGKGDYNMGKIINILPMANREDNLQEIMEALQEVKMRLWKYWISMRKRELRRKRIL